MIKKFKEVVAVGVLSRKDTNLIEDVLLDFSEKWRMSFETHEDTNGYISIQKFDKFSVHLTFQLNNKFNESKLEEFESDLENVINRLRKFEFNILSGAWGSKWGGHITYSFQLSREKEFESRIYLFETFIELEKKRGKEILKTEHKKAELIYKDDNLKIYVPKNLEATKKVSDPQWCTNNKSGFYKHNLTSNLYRFHFSDGYMLRLTWDYFDHMGDYSGGTHWGQGGMYNGERANYCYIRPKDEYHPFEFDYNKGDYRQYMVNKIKEIPQKAKDIVYQYQKDHQKEKLSIFNSMYKEIEKIKILNVKDIEDKYLYDTIITILYNGKKYDIELSKSSFSYSSHLMLRFSKEFEKDFKVKYALYDETIRSYLYDKIKEWIKKNR